MTPGDATQGSGDVQANRGGCLASPDVLPWPAQYWESRRLTTIGFLLALTFEVVASGTSYSTQKCSGYVELAPGDSTEVTSGNSVASVPIIFENLDGQRYRRRPRRGRITRRLLGDRGRVIAPDASPGSPTLAGCIGALMGLPTPRPGRRLYATGARCGVRTGHDHRDAYASASLSLGPLPLAALGTGVP